MRNESKFKARPQHQCESSLDQRHTPALRNFYREGIIFITNTGDPKMLFLVTDINKYSYHYQQRTQPKN